MEIRKWIIENHLCRSCGGRVLRCVEGNGMTPGGDQIIKCADCGKSDYGHVSKICWCGFGHRNQNGLPYQCLPFSEINTNPDIEKAFRACGCDPKKGEVGIVLVSDYLKTANK